MRMILKLLPYVLTSLVLYHEYSSGAFHKLYIQALLVNHEQVVVMYEAEWCPACQKIKPILQQMDNAGLIKLIKADVDKHEQDMYGVIVPFIPQISVYRKSARGFIGVAYFGQFPQTYEQMMSVLFDDVKADQLLINNVIGDLYSNEVE
jgi:thiol-disulfide isomerase/thioredoxin